MDINYYLMFEFSLYMSITFLNQFYNIIICQYFVLFTRYCRSPLSQNSLTVCLFTRTGKPKMLVGKSGYRIYKCGTVGIKPSGYILSQYLNDNGCELWCYLILLSTQCSNNASSCRWLLNVPILNV